jgi:hypothetical protein
MRSVVVLPAPGQAGHRLDQAPRISMTRRDEDVGGQTLLDDLAVLQYHDAVGAVGRHSQVVGDQQHRDAGVPDQALHVIQDPPLHGDVERAGGLVRDEQLRRPGERDGDQHPLAHAAGQLVRILPRAARRCRARPAPGPRRPRRRAAACPAGRASGHQVLAAVEDQAAQSAAGGAAPNPRN